MKKNTITGAICLVLALAIATVTGINFIELKNPGDIIPGPGVSEVHMLSEYFDGIAGTNGDTEIYLLKMQWWTRVPFTSSPTPTAAV